METTHRFRPHSSRRIPDPNFKKSNNAEHHVFVMPVRLMPKDISLEPNARTPKPTKLIYQQVERSLLNQDESEPDTFHLKNKGIVIFASRVKQVGDDEYDVVLRSGLDGIVDGGNTYKLIENHLDDDDLPERQFVMVEVRVGIPEEWYASIAGGLNTTVQVQPMSLFDRAALFQWIKTELGSETYYKTIAWSENDEGLFDARDIVSFMYLFNAELFPNTEDDHPVAAYEKKTSVLQEFEKKGESFKRIKPILKDILQFHDIVRRDARDLYNKSGGKGGALAFMAGRKRGTYWFPFTDKTDEFRLMNGALYPMLAAFRWYVVQDPETLELRWRDGFPAVLDAWKMIAAELMRATIDTSNALGKNPNAIGKSRNHWVGLHGRVAKSDLEMQLAKSAQV